MTSRHTIGLREYTKYGESGLWTDQGIDLAKERYYWKDEASPVDMCRRVANAVGNTDWDKIKCYDLLINQYFMFNTPTMMNIGTDNGMSGSACFVVPVPDDTISIMKALTEQVLIHRTGGGTGFAFSRLRPSGSLVRGTQGVASGPVSFMELFDAATAVIKQGGRRRGANMGVLRADHPDILRFITCKLPDQRGISGINNFNISVGATDAFMFAIRNDTYYSLENPNPKGIDRGWYEDEESMVERFSHPQFPPVRLKRDDSGAWAVHAGDIFRIITQCAWSTGDPGFVYLDRANNGNANPVPKIYEIETTNPCGEQYLEPYGVCNLGSINVAKYVIQEGEWPYQKFDWQLLDNHASFAAKMLDRVIDINPTVIPEIDENVKKLRRIGLGLMGLHDALLLMGYSYDSQEGRNFAHNIMAHIHESAIKMSEELAVKHGPFPLFSQSRHSFGTPRRNSNVTTIAPTGSISFFADCNGGCEPIFAYDYNHTDGSGNKRRMINTTLMNIASKTGVKGDSAKEIIANLVERFPEHDVKRIFATAAKIKPEDHILMQASLQTTVDNSVSKTVNLPRNATEEDIAKIYLLSYEQGCMGITVFRKGSKGGAAVLSDNEDDEDDEDDLTGENVTWDQTIEEVEEHIHLPRILNAFKMRENSPNGDVHVTVSVDHNNDPMEIFVTTGKNGSDIQALSEAMGRGATAFLRTKNATQRRKLEILAEQWKSIGGRTSIGFGPNKVVSLPDAVAVALGNFLAYTNASVSVVGASVETAMSEQVQHEEYEEGADICPECGKYTLVNEEGCVKCHGCGYSEC